MSTFSSSSVLPGSMVIRGSCDMLLVMVVPSLNQILLFFTFTPSPSACESKGPKFDRKK